MKYKVKKLMAILLTLAVIGGTLGTSEDFSVIVHATTYNGNCGNGLTWEFDSDTGILNITGTGSMYNYSQSSPAPWYSYCSQIKNIELCEGMTNISKWAFQSMSNLKEVNIPESVTEIGNAAFWGCSNLAEVNIPENVESIGSNAFYYCESLEEIHIPQNVISIGNNAFAACGSVMSITVDPGNQYYDSRDNCNAIIETASGRLLKGSNTTTTIPEGVTTIAKMAFYYCDKLTKIIIPDFVEVIEDSAFRDCSGLTELSIPCSIDFYQGAYTFKGCTNIQKVTITKGNGIMPNFIQNSSTDVPGAEYGRCPWNISRSSITELVIENGVKNIPDYAFMGLSGVTELVIPDSVTSIGKHAFYNLSNLKKLTMPASAVIYNDASTFYGCTALEKITLTKGTGIMPDYSDSTEDTDTCYQYTPWYNSRNTLKEIAIEDGVENIGNYTFCENTLNTTLILPKSINKVGTNVISSNISIKGYGDSAIYRVVKAQKNPWECIEHRYSSFSVEKEATCTEDGLMKVKCDYCDTVSDVTILASHAYVDKVIAPTSTEQGYTLHRCILCGQSYKDAYTDIVEETTQPEETTTVREDTPAKAFKVPDDTNVQEENIESVTTATVGKVKIKSAKNTKKKSIVLKLKKVKNAKKYRIQYSTSKKFKKNVNSRVTKKLKVTFKNLKKGKTYYIRVRAINGKELGAWSSSKKVKIKK